MTTGTERIAELIGLNVDRPEPQVMARLVLSGRADRPIVAKILQNAVEIFATDSRWLGRLTESEFDGLTYLDGRPIVDGDEVDAALWLSRVYGAAFAPATVGDALRAVGRENRSHPVRGYLSGLQWDGVARVDAWLSRYLSVEAGPLVASIGRCFLLSAVARIFSPGCKVDTVLILYGGQGAGKSSALRALGGAWFSDTPLPIGSDDVYDKIRGIWIYELAELDAFRRAEWPQIKALISSQSDNVRRKYARNAERTLRQSIFCGTTNKKEFLSDPSGSRRFHPVEVGAIDLAGLIADRDQLWAEAVDLYRRGLPWWLTRDEDQALASAAEEYEAVDPWFGPVARWAEGRGQVEIAAALVEALERPKAQHTAADAHRVAVILGELGYERKRIRSGGGRIAVWSRG